MTWDTSSVTIGRSTKKADYDRLRMNDQAIASGTFTFYGVKTWKAAQVYNAAVKLNAGVTGTCTFRGKTTFTATSIFNNRMKVNNRSDFSGSFNVVGTATITGQVIPSRGYLHGSIHTSSVSQNVMFDTLAPFLPNIGDSCQITARSEGTTTGYETTYTKATRASTNTITFYGIDDNLNMIAYTITNGAASPKKISIAW